MKSQVRIEEYQVSPYAHNVGDKTHRVTLVNEHGTEVNICTLGLILMDFIVLDKFNEKANIVLGCDTLIDYKNQPGYLGAFIGRYANRIKNATFTLGENYDLNKNGKHHLHGGEIGFDKKIWEVKDLKVINNTPTLNVVLLSSDMDENYPGNLTTNIEITLDSDNKLTFDMSAVSDAKTHVNLTHHAYFNLTGQVNGSLQDHLFKLNARCVTDVDADCIPSGRYTSIKGSGLDFLDFNKIDFHAFDDQMTFDFKGIDHNFVVEKTPDEDIVVVAQVHNPDNGLLLSIYSNQPGVQFYTGQYLADTCKGRERVQRLFWILFGTATLSRQSESLLFPQYSDRA